ncbi:MAG: hypothetical protein A2845_04530 [Candidatus Lloydbacteria bacterium RIFCSPHIGHO2_01_FULL_49_22]|uniref:Uncharacterized protein n=1 Tax=Candidatus Lloydbacteria bacterium RIFCSPHIGHO2_01_FULL_49_22 TaxID=1798658 RepID=A0A1G2CW15_9BACT|nr:MAG: hypothetical protein A2845_04530 [Candidatus Lloydbacteria bacterium RIFCSPHIGHO2_01_FULL_49_22]OGZ10083.1 MAG: hypothetical protein A3C14_00565 [Candidatus Lloydbacteria bacterium RIFCSPHIGHO2_02_FULL_50_18]
MNDKNTTDGNGGPFALDPALDQTPAQDITVSSDITDTLAQYEKKLAALREEVSVLTRDRIALAAAVDEEHQMIFKLGQDLLPILVRERSVIEALKDISIKERSVTDIAERRTHEQSRWKQVEGWYAVEQEKWEKQETLEAQKQRTEAHRAEHVKLTEKEYALRTEIEQVELAKEKAELHAQIEVIVESRVSTEGQLDDLEEKREKAIAQFQTITQMEEGIEKKELEVEDLLTSAHSLKEERTLVEERYALEKERHEAEASRWNIEDEIATIGGSYVESEKILDELKQKEKALLDQLAVLEKKAPLATPLAPISPLEKVLTEEAVTTAEALPGEGVVPPLA